MELDSAREVKAELLQGLGGTRAGAVLYLEGTTQSGGTPARSRPLGLAVGLVPRGKGFGLAVRAPSAASLRVPAVQSVLDRLARESDVRVVGPVFALAQTSTGSRLLPPASASALDVAVLQPGSSVGHPDVTAGSLGCVVRRPGGRAPLLLSNSHVLADSGRARLGDAVLSPAPADGGVPERDRVATLVFAEPLLADAGNQLDLALAELDDPARAADNTVVEGVLAGVVDDPLDGLEVAKVGRTTGHTTGLVTAVELDGVLVDYGGGTLLRFDDCLEVESPDGSFSEGGDSGSVIYRREDCAGVGLLFAGSTQGGSAGQGLTFANRLDLALSRSETELV